MINGMMGRRLTGAAGFVRAMGAADDVGSIALRV
jgi:hypothetical protein